MNRHLDENVVVETVISVQESHKSGNLSAVRCMIRRIPRRRLIWSAVVCSSTDAGQGAGHQVVDHRNTLCCKLDGAWGKKEIVVDQCRTMRNFHKDIFSHSQEQQYCILR